MIPINIEAAKNTLLSGQPVAIPTETVYGLAAIYNDEHAVRKVFDIKNRPLDHPLIMHIHDIEMISQYAMDIPDYVDALADAFSPGPLTFVVKKREHIPDQITAGQDTVAIRMPNHPKTLALLKALNTAIVAPSANPYCQVSPTSPAHVFSYFGEAVPIIDGGACHIGIESTIILATDPNKITILRPGMISAEDIERITQIPCELLKKHSVNVSGNKETHYAPKTPLHIPPNNTDLLKYVHTTNKNYCFLLLNARNTLTHAQIIMPNNPADYASLIYSYLHQVDHHYDGIILEAPPKTNDWVALWDRLNKASV